MPRPGKTSIGYRALARLADLALPLVAPLSEKLAAGDRERRLARDRWREWARASRDRIHPLLWVHAPSVGEGLQAKAVLDLLRPRHPDWQLIASFFSPSAAGLAAAQPVDRADYLPYDTAPNAGLMIAALAPTALVFTKADLWPELATRASAAGVKLGMIAGTVSPVSGRRRPLARGLTRAGYAALDRAGAIAAEDAEGLALLGTDPARIEVTGDPRFDSALARARAVPDDWPEHRLTAGAPTLVAGSTWPGDEDVLIPAFAAVRAEFPSARLVLVPHEPDDRAVARIESLLGERGIAPVRLSRLGPDAAPGPVVIVDRVGILARLYRKAAIGYVGGGFGTAGLHSVLEPAACGLPVVFGPRWRGSREAGLLIEVASGHALDGDPAATLTSLWRGWLQDEARRLETGRRALAVVEREIGAAERSAALIERLMAEGIRDQARGVI